MSHITHLVESLAWPVTVGLLIFWFRDEIRKTVDRLANLTLPGGAALTLHTAASVSEDEAKEVGSRAKWDRFANVYWLANDLRFTITELRLGHATPRIRHGLDRSIHHLKQLCLEQSTPGRAIVEARASIDGIDSISEVDRRRLAELIQ
jgi:hypothetical protein